jgi:hypothetical protein
MESVLIPSTTTLRMSERPERYNDQSWVDFKRENFYGRKSISNIRPVVNYDCKKLCNLKKWKYEAIATRVDS